MIRFFKPIIFLYAACGAATLGIAGISGVIADSKSQLALYVFLGCMLCTVAIGTFGIFTSKD